VHYELDSSPRYFFVFIVLHWHLYNTNMVKTCLWTCLKSQMIKQIGIESYIIFGELCWQEYKAEET
jgi:hypothetical protein